MAFEPEIRAQWNNIETALGGAPERIWLPVGSGTLVTVFSRIVNHQTEIQCVNVHVLQAEDVRIQALAANKKLTIFSAPESFADVADLKPEIPSNIHYDAKIWRFLLKHGQDGDLWWNVAR